MTKKEIWVSLRNFLTGIEFQCLESVNGPNTASMKCTVTLTVSCIFVWPTFEFFLVNVRMHFMQNNADNAR